MYVALVDLGPDAVAGMYQQRDGIPLILINSADHPVRQRFTLAHEFGHHCLGHGTVVDARIDPSTTGDGREAAANRFAAEFLMPRAGIDWWLQSHGDPEISLPTLVELAAHFGVSCHVGLIRLSEMRRIRPAVRGDIAARLEAQEHLGVAYRLHMPGLRDGLVGERRYRMRLPAATRRIFLRGLDEGLVSEEVAAERLHVSPAELRALRAQSAFE